MSVSLYQKIAQDLLAKIKSGEYPVGTLLPTEMELMDLHAASRNTVRSALQQLQDMGLISRRRNRGTMVEALPVAGAFAQPLSTLEDLLSLASQAQRKILGSEEVVIDLDMARDLKCAPGSRWCRISMIRGEPGAKTPLGWTRAYVDPHYAQVQEYAEQHPDVLLCDLIETTYGRRIVTIEQTVTGCLITEEHAQHLAVEAGIPGLRVLRQYRDPAGALVLFTLSVYAAHRYSLTTTMSRAK